jgi:hypothetical protein
MSDRLPTREKWTDALVPSTEIAMTSNTTRPTRAKWTIEMMVAAVVNPLPPTDPPEAAISFRAWDANTNAITAVMMGQTTIDAMARISAAVAFPDVRTGPP